MSIPESMAGPLKDVIEVGLLKFFKYDHLPEHLQKISKPFCELAIEMNRTLPTNEESTAMFRKLMEAKDCAVRSIL